MSAHSSPDSRVSGVKGSTIRIWIHERELGKLQQLLWEGYGDKLRTETTSNPQVKRFLASVPYIMGLIKEVHSAAIKNNADLLRKRTADPVPKEILLSKDANGLSPLHKAVGLGNESASRAILDRCSDAIGATDKMDRTPLHYCACLKGQQASSMYKLLMDYGAQPDRVDKRGKTWSEYRRSLRELDAPRVLTIIPDAPRAAAPPLWEWTAVSAAAAVAETAARGATGPTGPPENSDVTAAVPAPRVEPAKVDLTPSNDSAFGDDSTNNESEKQDEAVADKTETEDKTEADDEGFPESTSGSKEVEDAVAAADMERLAELVLKGYGPLLIGKVSDNPDVQLFISNVPQYIAKINGVHKGSREGDLRAVQTNLDRRKFSVAVDSATPLRPTPLHVAVLFGRTPVVRYLAGRFPECMHAEDSQGRTPLHYAAVLPDSGHIYSVLVTLGADNLFQDNTGKTADEYLKQGGLDYSSLMEAYSDRSDGLTPSQMPPTQFQERGGDFLSNNYTSSFPPEEGQYLASSLGDPLVKGLTEVAQLKPKDPVAHLANYLLRYSTPTQPRQTTQVEELEPETEADIETMPEEDTAILESNEIVKDDDIDTIEEDDLAEKGSPRPRSSTFKPVNRDEHGQSMIHYACARSHGRNGLFQLLMEVEGNIALRDGLYRTARDVAEQLQLPENVAAVDKYVVSLAATGENDKLSELVMDGYDHILDATDEGENIMDIATERNNPDTLAILRGYPAFQERREKLHRAVRFGSIGQVQEILRGARNLALSRNMQSRTSLHIAVLCQHESLVKFLAERFPEALHIGDNLMRTPLHYAMGVEKVEEISAILIASGAERVAKDLKGRQPSFYFMNKTDIQKLQDEEESMTV